jgi:hydrogenase expression/formation protein HypE
MNQLIERMFVQAFGNPALSERHDGATLALPGTRVAFTTDSYVVRPLFFPGGDIGSLAVHGTVNDLAMCGARPLYLSAGFIIEEGLPMETLWRVVQSMSQAALAAGVSVVTGDTKVVDRGRGDGIYINTAGIGVIEEAVTISPRRICPGDRIVVSGDLGRHGISIMAVREGLSFETSLETDSAPVSPLVLHLLGEGIEVHCLRDLTRGGLVSALNELAEASGLTLSVEEAAIPVHEEVRGACEILGLDPLAVANEGRFIAIVPPAEADRTVEILRRHSMGAEARLIGTVREQSGAGVTLRTRLGVERILLMPSGEQLPRIC